MLTNVCFSAPSVNLTRAFFIFMASLNYISHAKLFLQLHVVLSLPIGGVVVQRCTVILMVRYSCSAPCSLCQLNLVVTYLSLTLYVLLCFRNALIFLQKRSTQNEWMGRRIHTVILLRKESYQVYIRISSLRYQQCCYRV